MTKTMWALVALIIIVGGIAAWKYGVFGNNVGVRNSDVSTSTASQDSSGAAGQSNPQGPTISYTSAGFSPSTLTVREGEAVTWINNSTGEMWVASNSHPDHTLYDGTTRAQHCANPTGSTFDECTGVAPGQSWSFIFNKTGTWGYHNHMSPSNTGTVTVTQ